ncbi:phosphate transport system regulator PhoU [Spiroplasma helicoides]|uniref:Phosphate transport system regulator PhoU n=1 Tax=Spiroplasma helicoides TaxID=216938 RepID=A0A1B3SLB8_9MOLU|nr:phosphate signaling complex protein PhoU [Spiroplasma helicoides]AOG60707.1 phosphate transport system regulator PhoU [Spiroplasma helicoides]
MSYNKILDNDIKVIKKDLINIVELTKSQYAKTFEALKNNDYDLAINVVRDDLKINDAQNNFTRMALWKIAKQQMVAGDLRLAVGGVLISREIERIADVAKHICNFTIKYKPATLEIDYISKMFDLVNEMLNIISSLIENFDNDQHVKVMSMETDLHNQFSDLSLKLAERLLEVKDKADSKKVITIIRQLKNLERAGEHLINVEETVHFIRSGKFEEYGETILNNFDEKTNKK